MKTGEGRDDEHGHEPNTNARHGLPQSDGTGVSDEARFARDLLARHVMADVFDQTLLNESHSANRRMWLFGLYALMAHLRAKGERVTRASLARALECSQASLIGHLDRLAEVGLIVEVPDYDPRRRPYDVATPSVTEAIQTLRGIEPDDGRPDGEVTE